MHPNFINTDPDADFDTLVWNRLCTVFFCNLSVDAYMVGIYENQVLYLLKAFTRV